MFNFKALALLSSATLASIAFNGCKSSNDDNGNGGNTLTCGTTQCPNFDDYCCAGVNPGACYKKSEMPNERGLQCNTLMGPGGMGNSTFTNFGDNLGKIQNYGKINWDKEFNKADKDGSGGLSQKEFDNHVKSMTSNTVTYTTGDTGAQDPRKCCPPINNNGVMNFGSDGTITIDGKKVDDDKCTDGSFILSYKDGDKCKSEKIVVNNNDNNSNVKITGDLPANSVVL